MSSSDRLRRFGPWIAALIVLTVVGLAVYAYVDPEAFRPAGGVAREARPPALRGTACPDLDRARIALVYGDEKQAALYLREARRKAVEALDRNRIRFGRPEAVALRLSNEPLRSRPEAAQVRIQEKLEEISLACEELPA